MKDQNYAVGFMDGQPIEATTSFIDQQISMPEIQEHDILVQVKAVSVNPVDTKIRKTSGQQKELRILGFDGVGEVVQKGKKTTKFNIGDHVFYAGTTKRAGSNQKYQAVDERIAAKIPENLSYEECAAIPLTALTAYELLFEKFQLIPRENGNVGKEIVVINGAGGVGSILTQLASWAGLTVLATSSPKNFSWLTKMGVTKPINYHQSLSTQLKKSGIQTVEYVACLYDLSTYFDQVLEVIAPFGQIGTIVETTVDLPMNQLKSNSISFHWEYMFTKTDRCKNVASQGESLAFISTLLQNGKLQPTVTKVYEDGINAKNVKAATAVVESGRGNGKVVISGPFNGGTSHKE